MIFAPELARAVVRGRKTQTRRVLRRPPKSDWIVNRKTGRRRRRPPTPISRPIDGERYVACRYKPGHTYAVQPGRTKAGIGRLLITDVQVERVGAIDFDAARAEGFRTLDEFKAYWVRLHEPRLSENVGQDHDHGVDGPDGALDVIECVDLPDDLLVERFDARHADTLVWVITFELDPLHHPRLLAQDGGAQHDTDGLAYTESPDRALTEEPEAIDAKLLEYYVRDAEDRRAGEPGRREEALRKRTRSLTVNLRQEIIAADRRGVDVTEVIGQLEQLQEHLRVLERSKPSRKAA